MRRQIGGFALRAGHAMRSRSTWGNFLLFKGRLEWQTRSRNLRT